MTSRQAIGQRLQEMRQKRGLSPDALSHQLHRDGHYVSPRTIRRIEAGQCTPTVRVQFALATFYGLPFHELWSNRQAVVR